MERRAYTRQPLSLAAQLVRPGVGSQACTIQDFCPGGLFLALAESADASSSVEINDSVQVHFSTEPHGGGQPRSLRARVAGMFKGGLGCEFFDPDREALHALQSLANTAKAARSAVEPSSTEPDAPHTSPPPNAAKLIADCKKRLANYLKAALGNLFKNAEEALFLAARDAESNAEQNKFFEIMKDVERLKEPIDNAFFEVSVGQMDSLGAPLDAMQEPQEDNELSQLSLVESGEFADWLAVKQIHTKNEPRFRDALFFVEGRLGHLAGTPIQEENNPLGLTALCHTFYDAVQTITTPRLARRFVFEAFEASVVSDLDKLYDDLNSLLKNSGVLPDLAKPKPVVAKKASSLGSHGDPGLGPVHEPAGAEPQATASAQVNQPPAAQSPVPTKPAGAATSAAQAAASTGPVGVQPAVAQESLGQQFVSQHAASHPAGAPTHAGTPGAPAAGIEPGAVPIEGDVLATGEMALHPSLLGGTPFNRHAAASGTVYSSPMEITHSAYRAAQTLLEVAGQLRSTGGAAPVADALTYGGEQVRGALALLQHQESSQPTASESGPDLKTRVLRALRSRHGYADEKEIGEQEGNAIDVVSRLVGSILEDELLSEELKPRVRKLEVPLLNVAMRDPEFFTAPSHPARQVVNQLSRLHAPADDDGGMQGLDAIIDGIVERSAEDPSVFAEAAQRLARLGEQQAKFRQQNIENVVALCEEQQVLLRARAGDAARPRTDERELPEELKQWLTRAKRLQVGDAMLLDKDTENPHHAELAWIGDDHATYVFVDDQGMKAAALSLQELAMQLRRGSADVASEAELPALDRGLYAMLRKMHDQVVHQATHDQLTELLNGKEFETRLETALGEAKRDGVRNILCLMDLDHFHTVNETCGRKAGDRLLKELGRALRKAMGSQGVLARLEEDKFGVLLEKTTQEQGFKVADKQRAAIENFRATWKGQHIPLSVSIGMAELTDQFESSRSLFDAARHARAAAKAEGGNRIEVYRPKEVTAGDASPKDVWIDRIQKTLLEGRLQLRCQKISSIADEAAKPHYEVLLGVLGDRGETLLPGEFIQAAELYEQISFVDRWVVEHAFHWMSDNKRCLTKLGGLSINLSGQSLSDEDILEFVLDQFTKCKLPPAKVMFEVTESSSINSLSNAENFIRVLKEYGCRFLLDDFGSGHSSYSYLKHLPVDYVKIDGMFVRDITRNVNDHAMVKSINEIGHFMGKQTVAEFVENDAILDQLREIGVDYAQGFGIEKPRLLSELA